MKRSVFFYEKRGLKWGDIVRFSTLRFFIQRSQRKNYNNCHAWNPAWKLCLGPDGIIFVYIYIELLALYSCRKCWDLIVALDLSTLSLTSDRLEAFIADLIDSVAILIWPWGPCVPWRGDTRSQTWKIGVKSSIGEEKALVEFEAQFNFLSSKWARHAPHKSRSGEWFEWEVS